MKKKIRLYTKWSKGTQQNNLLTVVKEYIENNEVVFAKILFEI